MGRRQPTVNSRFTSGSRFRGRREGNNTSTTEGGVEAGLNVGTASKAGFAHAHRKRTLTTSGERVPQVVLEVYRVVPAVDG